MTSREFNWTPEFWEEWLAAPNPVRSYVVSRITEAALRSLNPQPGELVLNAGCGFGREASLILESTEGVRVVGVDISQEMTIAARRKLEGRYPFSVVMSSVECLPFPDNTFDRVLCLGVLMHVQDEPAACQELLRVLKPSGTLVTSFNSLLHPLSPLLWARLRMKARKLGSFKQSLRLPSYYTSKLARTGKQVSLYPGSFSVGRGPRALTPLWKLLDSSLAPAIPWATFEPILVCR